jgi:catechol 2,3-dioxygenase-like lactoylglutathione lyase family enzyme
MSSVQIEQKSYEMPPREGISIAHFLTVADIERSARYYEKVFGARILSLGDGNAPAYLQLANIWMILNVGGGPTPDKPTVTLSVPDPNWKDARGPQAHEDEPRDPVPLAANRPPGGSSIDGGGK